MLRILLLALVLPLCSYASQAVVRHIESGGIGYNDGYTTLEVFLSPEVNQYMPFLDCRGHVFNNGKWAANIGGGLRTLCNDRVYGINAYYDYRDVGHFNANQFGIGFESLGELYDFRINGYLPVGKKSSKPYDTNFAGFSGNHLLLSQKYKSAMKGVNAEFGAHLTQCQSFDIYAAVGPYYFCGPTWGGKARISGTYRDFLTLEISDSYDRTFHNNFQAQISLGFSFGCESCCNNERVYDRMLQSVNRQEIIVIAHVRKKNVAINPSTRRPYRFVFVDNTSNSNGTYESPYHSLSQAEQHSSINDIIYVYPGDGTTTGMDSGIHLKANQKFWGSGISHLITTAQGTVLIPAHSSFSPTITNTNVDTEGNAITLASNNSISGIIFDFALNDAIYGIDSQNLEVSSCTFKNIATFAIEAYCPTAAAITVTNNQFVDNVNGINISFNDTATLDCSNNTFRGQISVSNVPLEIQTNNNVLAARIENNIFENNITGSIRFNLVDTVSTDILVRNNKIANNGTGFQSSLGSSFVVLSNGTIGKCTIDLKDNLFTGNASNALYMHNSGAFDHLKIKANSNTISGIGGSGLVLATPVDTLTLEATRNVISECNDNAIAVISPGKTTTGNIIIKNNVIRDIGNASNGIAINQDFSALDLSITNNEISRCEGTGILSYAPAGIDACTLNISNNLINNCENLSANAASGIDIEQYSSLDGSIANNVLTDNTGVAVMIGSTLPTPTTCLTLTGNESENDYLLANPVDGLFNLAPCDVNAVNVGTINTSGTINVVTSCPDGTLCTP